MSPRRLQSPPARRTRTTVPVVVRLLLLGGALGWPLTLPASPSDLARGVLIGATLEVSPTRTSASDSSLTTVRNAATADYDDDNRAHYTSGPAEARVTIYRPGGAIQLTIDAKPGLVTRVDSLVYHVRVTNTGPYATGEESVLRDTLPAGLALLPGTFRTSQGTMRSRQLPDGRTLLEIMVGDIPVQGTVDIHYGVLIGRTMAPGSLVNAVNMGRPGFSADAEAQVATAVELPVLTVTKTTRSTTVSLGGELHYQLQAQNESRAVRSHETVLSDSLPASMAFVSATGSPVVQGQRVTWDLGTLAPTQSVARDLVVRIVAAAPTDSGVVNRADIASGSMAGRGVGYARAVAIDTVHIQGLRIEKRSGVLDAALGEAVPYTIVVTNTYTKPVAGIEIHDHLPANMRLVTKQFATDSSHVRGGEADFFIGRQVAPGDSVVIRYAAALLSGSNETQTNRAWALSYDGRLFSDTAEVSVRSRRDFEMRSGLLTGKVYLDRNGNGVQDADEPGVAQARLVTAEGEEVLTDRDGRFSMQHIMPGRHTVRLDPRSLPPEMQIPAGEDMATVLMTGWTSPHIRFRAVAGPVRSSPPLTRATHDSSTGTSASAAPDTVAAAPPPRGVRIFMPARRSVVSANRVFVGVESAPGSTITLLVDSTEAGKGVSRPDSVTDFVAVPLTAGPHLVIARSATSWGQVLADTIRIHLAGAPARIARAAADSTLRAGERHTVTLHVTDAWGVAPAPGTLVTVALQGGSIEDHDVSAASLGLQVAVDSSGDATVHLRAPGTTGATVLTAESGRAKGAFPFQVLPTDRPFMVTGAGTVGLGASDQRYGAISGRGQIATETALSVSFDSRRGQQPDEAFARGVNPDAAATMPVVGDSSVTHIAAATTNRLAARLEHRADWAAYGDVLADGFSAPSSLFGYTRALEGLSGQATRGAISIGGFASRTGQSLAQSQYRADGTSGPFPMSGRVRVGSEVVAIETHDRLNPSLVITRQPLLRDIDYDVDYERSIVLLRRVVPAQDYAGNPIYVVILSETVGGPAQIVGGLHATYDATARLRLRLANVLAAHPGFAQDSLDVTAAVVRDGGAVLTAPGQASVSGLLQMQMAGFRYRHNDQHVAAEVVTATLGDSSALGYQLRYATVSDSGHERTTASLSQVRGAIPSPVTARLTVPSLDLRVAHTEDLGTGALTARLEHQAYAAYGAGRIAGVLEGVQPRKAGPITESVTLSSQSQDAMDQQPASNSQTLSTKASLQIAPGRTVFAEGVHLLQSTGASSVIPEQIAVGGTYQVAEHLSMQASERLAWSDTARYATTSVGARATVGPGLEAWTTLDRRGGDASASHATLGLSDHLNLTQRLTLAGSFERRFGLATATAVDPISTLPFFGPEVDHTTLALALDWRGLDGRALGSSSEYKTGPATGGQRFSVYADLPFSPEEALLVRSDWATSRTTYTGDTRYDRTLVGYAFRPTQSDRWNSLLKLEWRRNHNSATAAAATQVQGTRLLAILDEAFTPSALLDLSARYALRWTSPEAGAADAITTSTRSQYVGATALRHAYRNLYVKLDGRLLHESGSAVSTVSIAEGVLYRWRTFADLEAGVRSGSLVDPDFTEIGGNGLYTTMSVRVTEGDLSSALAFWRARLPDRR